jgi:O-antigen ligase
MWRAGSGLFVDSNRFCGYSSDPNQVAEAIIFVPWLGFAFIEYVLRHKLSKLYIWWTGVAIVLSIYIGHVTDSDSYTAANVAAFCAWCLGYKMLTGKSWPLLVILVAVIAYCLIKGYDFSTLFSSADDYFQKTAAKDNQLNTRIGVWKHGIGAFWHSPIFGNGPGAYSGNWHPFGKCEPHNTFIYILMDHGIVGFGMIMSIFIRLGKKILTSRSPHLLAMFCGMLVFCFFHSFQRMPLFWFYLFLFNCMAERKMLANSKPMYPQPSIA